MSTAIEFDHVGKQYRLGLVSTKTLSHDLNRWWQTAILKKEDPYLKIGAVNDRTTSDGSDYVWALRDIDFKVEQGDVVGIIGKNGAGKSTLLKLLSRVTGPTVGEIRAHGRIGSLLEVGTGFHPEMTGRENIYMNGAIMGMTKAEISRKLDEIVDFSGCERYIDTPVKRYSSGMTVRLGFAVAAHLEPEILVVDEVLAVGDAEFQKKAIGKMQDLSKGEGRTVLFVSHNMASIKALCNHGVLLENGMVKMTGDIDDIVDHYLFDNGVSEHSLISNISIINKSFHIDNITVNDDSQSDIVVKGNDRTIDVKIQGRTEIPMNISFEAFLYDSRFHLVGTYSPSHSKGTRHEIKEGDYVIEENISLPKQLCIGDYHLSISLSQMNIEKVAEVKDMLTIHIPDTFSPVTGVEFNSSYFGSLIIE